MTRDRTIAYFSMEVGFDPDVPTYSGGLGVLSGDTLRSAADSHLPVVAVSLLHRQGYFFQRLNREGWQEEEPTHWAIDDFLEDTGARVTVTIESRPVTVRAWKYDVQGSGHTLPIFLLDTAVENNDEAARALTDRLYGGDDSYRLAQEIVLGIAGVRILRALGYNALERFHMNEGHAALLTLELLREQRESREHTQVTPDDIDAVRKMCVFTTHTPVSAGHDQFALSLAERLLGDLAAWGVTQPLLHENRLNMTSLALAMSHYVNGVAKRHRDVSQSMFRDYKIDSITNGVHAATWAATSFAELFDRRIPGWRDDNFSLRSAVALSDDEVWEAHQRAKRELLEEVNHLCNAGFDHDALTLGLARRATAYKRLDLILTNLDRLRRTATEVGPLQLVFAGKAHPRDAAGKQLIQRIVQLAQKFDPLVRVAYLENYDMRVAAKMVAGCDVWVNTPLPPLEASGTSGMKAALNGVPSLSVLDGWWIEGCIEGRTGWGIGEAVSLERGVAPASAAEGVDPRQLSERHAEELYKKLEQAIVPMFYEDRPRFIDIMRNSIAINGSYFNTQRMIQQYAQKAYL